MQRRSYRKATPTESRQLAETHPAWWFPIQHEIQILQEELNEFNARITELDKVGHQSRATDVLKENAIDFARQIDELRCLLVEPAVKNMPKIESNSPRLSKS